MAQESTISNQFDSARNSSKTPRNGPKLNRNSKVLLETNKWFSTERLMKALYETKLINHYNYCWKICLHFFVTCTGMPLNYRDILFY